jgi:hypothetical protein
MDAHCRALDCTGKGHHPMTARAEKEALEAAGFVRLPTLWVYPEEAARIYQIAKPHKDIVQGIKKQVRKNCATIHEDN